MNTCEGEIILSKKECKDHLGNIYSSIADMCRFYKLTPDAYKQRIKSGWSIERALTEPTDRYSCKDHLGNAFSSEKEMCKFHNIDYKMYFARTRNMGWSVERALTESCRDDSIYDFNGRKFKNVTEMCEFYKISATCYKKRIKNGWSVKDALTIASGKRNHKIYHKGASKQSTDHLGNDYISFVDMCNHYDISANTVYARLKKGWILEDALTKPLGFHRNDESIKRYKKRNTLTNTPCTDHIGTSFDSRIDMCNHYGITLKMYSGRMGRGWSLEETLTTGLRKNRIKRKTSPAARQCCDYNGIIYKSLKDMANAYGLSSSLLDSRLRRGWSLEEALTTPAKRFSIDHLGQKYNSDSEMARAWGILPATYRHRRVDLGWSLEEALTNGKCHNSNHRTTGKEIHYNGIVYPSLVQLCKAKKLNAHTVQARLDYGWTIEEAVEDKQHIRRYYYDHLGNEFDSIDTMTEHYGITPKLYRSRIHKGWTLEEVLTIPKNMYIGEYRVAECLKRLNVKFYHDCSIKTVFKDLAFDINWNEFLDVLHQNLGNAGINWSKSKIQRLRPDFVLYTDNDNKICGVIEFDGAQHQNFVEYFFRTVEEFLYRSETDFAKQSLWEYLNIPMLRIRDDQSDMIDNMVKDFIDNPQNYIHNHNTYLSEDEYWSILSEEKAKLELAFAS